MLLLRYFIVYSILVTIYLGEKGEKLHDYFLRPWYIHQVYYLIVFFPSIFWYNSIGFGISLALSPNSLPPTGFLHIITIG